MIDPAEVEVKFIATIRRMAKDRGWSSRELLERINEQLPPECQIKVTRWWALCSAAYRRQCASGKTRGAIPMWFVAAACRALDSAEPADSVVSDKQISKAKPAWVRGMGTPAPASRGGSQQ